MWAGVPLSELKSHPLVMPAMVNSEHVQISVSVGKEKEGIKSSRTQVPEYLLYNAVDEEDHRYLLVTA